MKVFTKNAELSREMARGAGRTGLVPTMGALHEGHLSLVKKCRAECDRAVVSVFVNPTQFNDPNDLKNYPRTEEADLALLEKTGVDYVLMPSVEDIYPQKDTRVFDLGTTDKTMEGAHRPGHFNGVAQVVSRLFDIVRPERAYFGEKDFQQIAVIREMVRRYGYPVQIIACPIVRGADGLALSSRNALLTPAHRAAAPTIYGALSENAAAARTMSVEEPPGRRAYRRDEAAEDGISFGRPRRDARGDRYVERLVPDALLHSRTGGRHPPDRQHRHRLAPTLRNAGPDKSAVFEYSDIFI